MSFFYHTAHFEKKVPNWFGVLNSQIQLYWNISFYLKLSRSICKSLADVWREKSWEEENTYLQMQSQSNFQCHIRVWCSLGANTWLCTGCPSNWLILLLELACELSYLCLNKKANQTCELNKLFSQYPCQVMDFDTIGRNELIGKLCLGCKYIW